MCLLCLVYVRRQHLLTFNASSSLHLTQAFGTCVLQPLGVVSVVSCLRLLPVWHLSRLVAGVGAACLLYLVCE